MDIQFSPKVFYCWLKGDAMQKSLEDTSSGQSTVPPNIPKELGSGAWEVLSRSDVYHASSDATLFSLFFTSFSSCQVLDKFNLDVDDNELVEDDENNAIGSLVPDDKDELLAGIMDGFDIHGLSNQVDDLEEDDLFGSG